MPSKLPSLQPIWLPVRSDFPSYPQLSGEMTAATVVIGGGMAGLMTAWRMAEQGQSVILLEQHHLLNGDTGYTTSFVTRVPDTPMPELVKNFSLDQLWKVWQAAVEAQTWLRETVRREGIDCDWTECASYIVSEHQNDQGLHQEYEILHQLDDQIALATPSDDANLPAGTVEAIRIPNEAHMHIRKFVASLLGRPIAKRITIFENSEVERVIPSGQGVTIKTVNGQIQAQRVLITTGHPALLPELSKVLKQSTTYVVAAEYPAAPPISNHTFWDTDNPYQYYRRVGEHTVMLGGADHASGHPVEAPDHPFQLLVNYLDRKFPGYTKLTHRWSGGLVATADGLPVIGWMPGTTNVGVATGFKGSGMVYGSMSGMLLGELVLGHNPVAGTVLSPSRLKLAPIKLSTEVPTHPTQPTGKNILRWVLPLVAFAILFYPGYVFLSARGGFELVHGLSFRDSSLVMFPLYGLYAFTLLWIQLMIGSLMPRLRKLYPGIEGFHRAEGLFVLMFATIHPLWLLMGVGIASYWSRDFVSPEQRIYIWFAYTALFLMYLTVSAALLRRWSRIKSWWRKIHVLNYALFYFAWWHSWNLGSDVQYSGLRWLWWMFIVTATGALVWRLVGRRRPAVSPAIAGDAKNYVPIAKLDQISEGFPFCGVINGKAIALFKVSGQVYALDNQCSHADGPLCEGFIDGNVVECPLHASRFDVRTGAVVEGPATDAQTTYPVRVQNGQVEIAV